MVLPTTRQVNKSGVQESGAINESMSDIMGKCVQFWAKSADIDWRIGNDMNWILRDMSNPNALGDQTPTRARTGIQVRTTSRMYTLTPVSVTLCFTL